MRNILLVHGFNGMLKIFDYFKKNLTSLGFNVIMPIFPIREEITIEGYFDVFDRYRQFINKETIVVAHSIGNAMFIKYLSKNELQVSTFISLAGFSDPFYNQGKDILNEKVALVKLSDNEKKNTQKFINKRYSIYSNDDHIVPYKILKNFSKDINSLPIEIKNIGHMGKKSGLEELPQVINIIKTIDN